VGSCCSQSCSSRRDRKYVFWGLCEGCRALNEMPRPQCLLNFVVNFARQRRVSSLFYSKYFEDYIKEVLQPPHRTDCHSGKLFFHYWYLYKENNGRLLTERSAPWVDEMFTRTADCLTTAHPMPLSSRCRVAHSPLPPLLLLHLYYNTKGRPNNKQMPSIIKRKHFRSYRKPHCTRPLEARSSQVLLDGASEGRLWHRTDDCVKLLATLENHHSRDATDAVLGGHARRLVSV